MDELWDRIWPLCVLAAVLAVIAWGVYLSRQEYAKSRYAQEHGLRWAERSTSGWEPAR
jgi:hypothetical protein